jgi:hypothetical protein
LSDYLDNLIQHASERAAASAPVAPPAGPPPAGPVSLTDVAAAARGLIRTGEASDFDSALRRIAGQDLSGLGALIAEERQLAQAEADAVARAAWERSPEGRAAKAEALLAQQAEAAKRDRLARALLEDQGWGQDLDFLTADERARAAGLIADTAPDPNDVNANLAALSDEDREWIENGAKISG